LAAAMRAERAEVVCNSGARSDGRSAAGVMSVAPALPPACLPPRSAGGDHRDFGEIAVILGAAPREDVGGQRASVRRK
jgi:hypothetical protein